MFRLAFLVLVHLTNSANFFF
uniref:Uncharacterized protein n=1 Tax=Arundo donax TaxID=35708 RepID=A0A0A9EIP3_ARUDO